MFRGLFSCGYKEKSSYIENEKTGGRAHALKEANRVTGCIHCTKLNEMIDPYDDTNPFISFVSGVRTRAVCRHFCIYKERGCGMVDGWQ